MVALPVTEDCVLVHVTVGSAVGVLLVVLLNDTDHDLENKFVHETDWLRLHVTEVGVPLCVAEADALALRVDVLLNDGDKECEAV